MRIALIASLAALACSSPELPAADEFGDRRYSVALEAPSALSVGQAGSLDLAVRPKAGRHLSTEFPTRLELRTDGGITAPGRLEKSEAKRLDEKAIDYAAPLHAEAPGKATIHGTLQVGVCTGDRCERVELHFEREVQVR